MNRGHFPNLFAPIRIGHVDLDSRMIMGSMHTGLEENGDWKRVAEFYSERALGGVPLMVTGGMAPNPEGGVFPGAAGLYNENDMAGHRYVTERVHDAGGRIALQVLHAGRYAYGKDCVAPSAIRSPISPYTPRELDETGIRQQIDDISTLAARARQAGYDGVEIMGSEGYLLNQFLVERTNRRDDKWGGSYRNRMRFPVEVMRQVRKRVGNDFLVIFRLSMIDLVPGGSTWDEVVELALLIEKAGASVINTGIGWHEAKVPTIATSVPRQAFTWVTAKLMGKVGIPVIASNRVNSPEVAEQILAEGQADLVSMARPFLADPEFMNKARQGQERLIAPCIACNQACLDHTFTNRISTCLVNARSCHETELRIEKAVAKKSIGVVGAGPAGLSTALVAAERGHSVTLFEKDDEIGGQLNLARLIPGKEEFHGLVDWYRHMLADLQVEVNVGHEVDADMLGDFDEIVIATGVNPHVPDLPGKDGKHVMTYVDALADRRRLGEDIAIIGAGGIGFDMAEFAVSEFPSTTVDSDLWKREWGVADPDLYRGGLHPDGPRLSPPPCRVTLMQRSPGRPGRTLGKTTGWIHRAALKMKKVRMIGGVSYEAIDGQGVRIRCEGRQEHVPADTVVLCTGQLPNRTLVDQLIAQGTTPHVIGGAESTAGLDAKRAVDQGTRLAAVL